MSQVPACRTVTVYTFRGDRTSAFRQRLFAALAAERSGLGRGPTKAECLLYAGHTGVSIDSGATVFGFNPDGGRDPTWRVLDNLRNGRAYPGVVEDDTAVFAAARQHGLAVLTFGVVLPEPRFKSFQRVLSRERGGSQFSYGFPDGDGDCNCTTWLERLGLLLLTGRMDEFTAVTGVAAQTRRRFGLCN